MASSTSNVQQVSSSQASKEVTVNGLFDAASPSLLYGRKAETTLGLTWGYYGGTANLLGVLTVIANGTVALTASTTNYIEANPNTGAVTKNTVGFTTGFIPLYSIVVGASTVTSYIDKRTAGLGSLLRSTVTRIQTVAYAAAVTLDCSLYDIFEVGPLTGPIAITFSNPTNGQRVQVSLTQDATGGRTITWSSTIAYGSDLTAINSASNMTASKTDEYGFRYHTGSAKYRMIACARGY